MKYSVHDVINVKLYAKYEDIKQHGNSNNVLANRNKTYYVPEKGRHSTTYTDDTSDQISNQSDIDKLRNL